MTSRLLPVLILLTACAGSDDGGSSGAHEGRVADPCQADADCQVGLTCLTLDSAGFCGKRCGPTEGCPTEGDNVCVRLDPASYGDWCLRRCAVDVDCGDGLACRDLAVSATYGVCFP